MAHFAKLDKNNLVINVAVVANNALDPENEEASGVTFLTEWSGGHSNWKQTSYNNKFRKRFAGEGFTYDTLNDVFIEPKPFPSWSLDDNFDWQAPTPKPKGDYRWDELTLSWIEIETL